MLERNAIGGPAAPALGGAGQTWKMKICDKAHAQGRPAGRQESSGDWREKRPTRSPVEVRFPEHARAASPRAGLCVHRPRQGQGSPTAAHHGHNRPLQATLPITAKVAHHGHDRPLRATLPTMGETALASVTDGARPSREHNDTTLVPSLIPPSSLPMCRSHQEARPSPSQLQSVPLRAFLEKRAAAVRPGASPAGACGRDGGRDPARPSRAYLHAHGDLGDDSAERTERRPQLLTLQGSAPGPARGPSTRRGARGPAAGSRALHSPVGEAPTPRPGARPGLPPRGGPVLPPTAPGTPASSGTAS